MQDITFEKEVSLQRQKLMEQVMSKEFGFLRTIEMLKNRLINNNIDIPKQTREDVLIEWNNDFIIGVSAIDKQHMKWIDIINNLYLAFKEGKAQNELNGFISDILDYTDYHFKFEEKYFEDFNYINKGSHEITHETFVEQLKTLQDEHEAGKLDAAYNLMTMLQQWVSKHILIEDKKYVDTFRKNGLT